jgi:translation initiation factor IF-3
VRLIDADGAQAGVMPLAEAQARADAADLDLVEVAPTVSPPVCRLLDFGQFRYENQKREREARRHQRTRETKEVRLSLAIGEHDFLTKVRHAASFLAAGDHVRMVIRLRGRAMTHADLARGILERAAVQLAERGSVERAPTIEGANLFLLLVPLGNKPHAAPPPVAPPAPSAAATLPPAGPST